MSNVEQDPAEQVCQAGAGTGFELMEPRLVPLGGPRAMLVRRTLPQRQRSLIGAWCFVDHYGPDRVSDSGGMVVTPHPHTGLQTVSWLFTGEIEHRDSIGTVGMVRPREVNLMTAGRGISHSEISTPDTDVLHGAQLWVALPEEARFVEPAFEHHAPPTVTGDGWQAEVFLGSALGHTSPVRTFTPLLGAEVRIEAGGSCAFDLDETHEIGVLVDAGTVTADASSGEGDCVMQVGDLGYFAPGRKEVVLHAGDAPVRLLVIGGPPFGEQIVMWWNFVGRSHDEVVAFRDEWQTQVTGGAGDGQPVVGDSQQMADGRFGLVIDQHAPPIPAPPLPNARLKLRD